MKSQLIVLIPIVLGLSIVYLPNFWVSILLLVDFHTPWNIHQSVMFQKYHDFLLSRLPVRDELPIPEIDAKDATNENIIRITKSYTWPIVIRGLLGNSSGVKNMGNLDWWREHYPNEEILCSRSGPYLSTPVDNCTMEQFFERVTSDDPYYIVGATSIFKRHPELHDMVNSEGIDKIEPGLRLTTQMFMGLPGQGTDIHCAAGVNIFRQVVGSKKWWFIPPSQTPYLKPTINVNGFSAFTHTLVGKDGKQESEWMKKIERYTAQVNPGDVLINPPWFWHGILNLGDRRKGDIVIGAPSRYSRGDLIKSAFKSNPLLTIVGLASLVKKYGLKVLSPEYSVDLEKGIVTNRKIYREENEARNGAITVDAASK